MYVQNDGTEVSKDQIRAAFNAGQTMIVHGWRGDGQISTGLRIDGLQVDTRGAWEETWTVAPKILHQALDAARLK